MADETTPFQHLLEIDRRCRQRGSALPERAPAEMPWRGVGFRLRQHCCVVPMGELGEVLHEPPCTALPGVRDWVHGVANLRGRLLPVIDLGAFLGLGPTPPGSARRVLVVERGEIFAGLLVDEVFGLQHFAAASLAPAPGGLAGLAPLVRGRFCRERDWLVFGAQALVASTAFLEVAR